MLSLWTLLWLVALVAHMAGTALVSGAGTGGVLAMGVVAIASGAGVVFLDRRFKLKLLNVFMLALAMRWGLALVIQYLVYGSMGYRGLFAPDELLYDYEARLYSAYLAGHAPLPDALTGGSASGVVYLASWLYYAFGSVVIVPKLLFCTLGAWCCVFTTVIGAQIDPEVGKRAGMINAFFPSVVLWTSLLLKDGPALFGAELALMSFMLMMRTGRMRPWLVALMAAGVAVIGAFRAYEILFVVGGIAGSFFLTRGQRSLGLKLTVYLAISVLLVLVMSRVFTTPIDFSGEESALAKVATIRSGLAEGTGSAVAHDLVDVRTVPGLLAWIPIGLAYFFFAPIPFTGTSIISSFTSPEMIAWYLMLPSIWRGLRYLVRHHLVVAAPILLYAAISSVGWCILVTNVGTIYRFRAHILFVALVCFAVNRAQKHAAARPPEPA